VDASRAVPQVDAFTFGVHQEGLSPTGPSHGVYGEGAELSAGYRAPHLPGGAYMTAVPVGLGAMHYWAPSNLPDQLTALAYLHQNSQLTDEEFERAKRVALGPASVSQPGRAAQR